MLVAGGGVGHQSLRHVDVGCKRKLGLHIGDRRHVSRTRGGGRRRAASVPEVPIRDARDSKQTTVDYDDLGVQICRSGVRRVDICVRITRAHNGVASSRRSGTSFRGDSVGGPRRDGVPEPELPREGSRFP